jgi:catechol 2,3-dioxygenase-like lactoylglutathione lyase family enzyme
MIKTRGVVHFSIPVTDIARSREFYCQTLGMNLIFEDLPVGMVFLDCAGDCIVLVRVDRPISTAQVRGVHHAFLVGHDEYQAAVEELRSIGARYHYEENRQDGVIDGPRAYFEDPDGNMLEIIDLNFYAGAQLGAVAGMRQRNP